MKQFIYQVRYALPIWMCMLLTSWLPDNRISVRLRGILVSPFLNGMPIGLTIGRDVTLLGIDQLRIGKNVYLAKGVWINALGSVVLEDEVMVGPYCVLVSTNHTLQSASVVKGGTEYKSIKIGKGSWIAAHCTIIAGVEVGQGNVIAANSVVTRDTDDLVVMAGTKAQMIKRIEK